MFSFECIYAQLDAIDINPFYMKVIGFGILPVLISALGGLAWILIYRVCLKFKRAVIDVRVNLVVTVFVIIFLCYPIVTNLTFALYSC